jgi:hypothetical protein
MLTHSFVLDCLDETGADTFAHFEVLIEEHRMVQDDGSGRPSRLKLLVPTVGTFHTPLPLRQAFQLYNEKHQLTKRKHIQISFNEVSLTLILVVMGSHIILSFFLFSYYPSILFSFLSF